VTARKALADPRVRIALVALLVTGLWFGASQLLPDLNLQKLLEDLSNKLGAWTYLIVGVFAFLETGAFVGLVVPGETVMLLGGAVAGQGAISIYLLIAIAWFSAWLGDTTSFFIGRRLGRGFLLEHGPRVGINEERFGRVESYFDRHGGKTILIGRFVSLVRALAPFIAGSSRMRYRAFVPYSILGTGLWSSAHILIGYFASRSIDKAAKYAGRGAFLLASTIVVVAAIVIAIRFLRVADNRRRVVGWMKQHRLTRPLVALGRRLEPEARFVWARLTPGGTFGLEVTTLLAMLAVALFVLVAYTVIISGDPGPTPGDLTAIDVANRIQVAWLTSIAKVITNLGSAAVTYPLALICAIVLGTQRRWYELAVLLVGMLIIWIGVHDLKVLTDRPRPPDPLTGSSGSAFPSGHAAYSTIYVWLAMTFVLRLRPGMVGGSAVIAAGLATTAVVGLSRVYLQVHYLSDVSSGWALGVSAFSLCAIVALISARLRQNPARVSGAGI
jgi:membrane protein DedA with SNARE-associated domain/membrane-associated phospholipid phosphatase